jgi:hypothetical protein
LLHENGSFIIDVILMEGGTKLNFLKGCCLKISISVLVSALKWVAHN